MYVNVVSDLEPDYEYENNIEYDPYLLETSVTTGGIYNTRVCILILLYEVFYLITYFVLYTYI